MQRKMIVFFMVLGMLAPVGVYAAEVPTRSYGRFAFDSTTARGFWTELGVNFTHFEHDFDDEGKLESDGITVHPTFAYGGEAWEAGVLIPFLQSESRYCPDFGRCSEYDTSGVGDIQLFGKYVARFEHVHIGGGIDLSLPSGNEKKGRGTGQLGVAPFATGAVLVGPVQLRAHLGGMLYADSDYIYGSGRFPRDVLFYGGGAFYGINEIIAVRAEVIGTHIVNQPDFADNVSFQPGVDIRISLGLFDMLIRPTALVGLTDAAPDWGIGGAIALVQAEP